MGHSYLYVIEGVWGQTIVSPGEKTMLTFKLYIQPTQSITIIIN